jgi:hypothetical protein
VPACRPHAPPQKEIAGRLRNPVPVHDPLAMVGEDALSSIGFQDRSACFFDLEKEWILCISQEQHDPTPGADATDADDLDCDVSELIMTEE